MGCSSCSKGGGKDSEGGCESHKGPQRILFDQTLAAVYPDRTWGNIDEEASFLRGVRTEEVRRIGQALSVATRAPSFYRAGGPDDLCDFIYVLCVGREPSLLDVRDGIAPISSALYEGAPEGKISERYLRIAFSSITRAATVQEVAFELEADGDTFFIRESPQPGVYDPILLKRMRTIVDFVEANDIEHLDFGLCDKPAPDVSFGDYVERFSAEPAWVNFLFYAQPARTSSVTVLSTLPR